MVLMRFVPRVVAMCAALALAGCATGARTTESTRTTTQPAASPATVPAPMSYSAPAATPTSTPPSVVKPLSLAQRKLGFLDIHTVVPDAIVDMRYATARNFTGVRLESKDARCLIHKSMAPGLREGAKILRAKGYVLYFFDCYRPHSVQRKMWDVVPNPMWIAKPGSYSRSHESGRSVDVTIAKIRTGRPVDTGTGYDNFTSLAWAYQTKDLTKQQIGNRATLRKALERDGSLHVYTGEWWHFDGPHAGDHLPIVDVPEN